MTKVLVKRELLERITSNNFFGSSAIDELRAILAQPAHDVEASVPTFPCEFCGVFHSYSEVSDAGGYCPQCEADYDERQMFADLLARYTALAAAPQPVSDDVSKALKTAANRMERLALEVDGDWRGYATEWAEEALAAYRAAMVSKHGWIPVSERLPEVAVDVLVYGVNHGSASYTVAGLFSGEWASQETEETTRFEPTHWMPLPSAPKGGE